MDMGPVAICPSPGDYGLGTHPRVASDALSPNPSPSLESQTSLQGQTSSKAEKTTSINTFAVIATVLLYDDIRSKWEEDRWDTEKYESLLKAGAVVMDLVLNAWELEPQAVEYLSGAITRIRRAQLN
ncbi:hypothetical protein FA13DRAFT_1709530 [Coprinellus micaceus]|uniref:Uncharacterized protein n=1 Tax=Coprinellus micaceus TaxID=71717 RepID=A0A4Y7TDE2_COPMI|nr:hypothetical protein FA13DRAFT_1709530 [Coprinellus micaceus]